MHVFKVRVLLSHLYLVEGERRHAVATQHLRNARARRHFWVARRWCMGRALAEPKASATHKRGAGWWRGKGGGGGGGGGRGPRIGAGRESGPKSGRELWARARGQLEAGEASLPPRKRGSTEQEGASAPPPDDFFTRRPNLWPALFATAIVIGDCFIVMHGSYSAGS